MKDFLAFRRMIVPKIIHVIFWIGVAMSIIGGIVMVANGVDGRARFVGVALIVLGPILARIWCEILILAFRINETLTEALGALNTKQDTSDERLTEALNTLKTRQDEILSALKTRQEVANETLAVVLNSLKTKQDTEAAQPPVLPPPIIEEPRGDTVAQSDVVRKKRKSAAIAAS